MSATAAVRPALGRWEGRSGAARIVLTVEAAASGRRYVVRPVVHCGPGQSTSYETGLFSLFQPDAWPIQASGTITGAPLTGRFERDAAKLQVAAGNTCARRGARFTARPAAAAPIVADGSWSLELAPHDHGLIGETTQFATRGEGAVVDSTWGVYDGPACLFLRTGVELLVNADGSFSAVTNGNALATNLVSIHLSGAFLSSGVAQGTYSLTGPGCSGAPVAFTATFGSPYQRPRAAGAGEPLAPAVPRGDIVRYVALGDSYSSGHGVRPYDVGTDVRSGPTRDLCHRSRYAYSRELALRNVVFARSFFACSGATTENVTTKVQYPVEGVTQLGRTAELSTADLVTISIGGNNVHFDDVLNECSRPKGSCSKPGQRERILDAARGLQKTLADTYAALRAAVPPSAAVLVLGYPQLVPANGFPARCQPERVLFDRDVQRFLRQAANVLHDTIAAAASTAGVQFVDVMPIFAGHEICGPKGGYMIHVRLRPQRGNPPVGAAEESVHPDRLGQAAYARAIEDYIRARIAAHAPLTPTGLPANPAPQP